MGSFHGHLGDFGSFASEIPDGPRCVDPPEGRILWGSEVSLFWPTLASRASTLTLERLRTSGGTAPGWVGVASTGCLTLYATGPAGVVGCGREAARIIIPRLDKSDAPS